MMFTYGKKITQLFIHQQKGYMIFHLLTTNEFSSIT